MKMEAVKVNGVAVDKVLEKHGFVLEQSVASQQYPAAVYTGLDKKLVITRGVMNFLVTFRSEDEETRVAQLLSLTPVIKEIYGRELADWFRLSATPAVAGISKGRGAMVSWATSWLRCHSTRPRARTVY